MAKKTMRSPPARLRGTIVAFNISPRGHIDGAMVDTTKGRVQVNFPRHEADVLLQSMRVGSKIDLEAELESDTGEHAIYWAGSETGEASGTIVRLNYASHGEVNGYHLDDKTFLHVKPEGAERWKLSVGDEVRASGLRRVGPDAVVLEVNTLERAGTRRDGTGPQTASSSEASQTARRGHAEPAEPSAFCVSSPGAG